MLITVRIVRRLLRQEFLQDQGQISKHMAPDYNAFIMPEAPSINLESATNRQSGRQAARFPRRVAAFLSPRLRLSGMKSDGAIGERREATGERGAADLQDRAGTPSSRYCCGLRRSRSRGAVTDSNRRVRTRTHGGLAGAAGDRRSYADRTSLSSRHLTAVLPPPARLFPPEEGVASPFAWIIPPELLARCRRAIA
jgi:hypothetical protein